ncbi:MFS transporter [Oceanobacillus sp. FSL W7-1293]|uniref:MFS transporter n=1 Tax=Oceanobacillus sp. FSL W7-1293 TaxID=2921699 RepID=UPI0030CE84D9
MNKGVYLLMTISFVVGMVELIIGGILDLVAADLGVSLGKAGLLITIFSLVFAVASPILLYLTASVERKKLTIISLFIFLLGNILAVFSLNYTMIFISRIISAASASLLIVLCTMMAASIVKPAYRGRAIGTVSMGVSGSLVFGIPFGLILGESFGWRAPFVLIALLTIASIICVYLFMQRVPSSEKPLPITTQMKMIRNPKVLFILLTTFFVLAGHTALYGYLNPFVKDFMELDGIWLSAVYLIFGISAVSGGGTGGTLSDLFGPKRTILAAIGLFVATILIIPASSFHVVLFLVVLILWGMLSWAVSPPVQSYLIETSPQNSSILVSLNNSALHLGIAVGSFVGSIVIEQAGVDKNAYVGGAIVLLGLFTALIALKGYKRPQVTAESE